MEKTNVMKKEGLQKENNLKDKERFFALYWGQRVLRWRLDNENLDKDLERVSANTMTTGLSRWVAQLKPLSAISDEDALEVGKFLGLVNPKAIRVFDNAVIVEDYLYRMDFNNGDISMYEGYKRNNSYYVRIADKVRSMGYLYEFMDLSCEELLNRGWAVLEE